ncbi:hypothetical protein DSO57_1029563 [Entomophthora muscae]|uniref:Uncharacterized protein n=1 Tax=Entomophthora muscae TaxID=34485 RepID=A0ACC2UBZ2_9FUNG|nr:hypothetical protein DSO57_1029563 [Entomophthora muscae]
MAVAVGSTSVRGALDAIKNFNTRNRPQNQKKKEARGVTIFFAFKFKFKAGNSKKHQEGLGKPRRSF